MTTVVFDKTGTITHGKPTVANLLLTADPKTVIPIGRMLTIIGAAEAGSEHPLAKAIVGFTKSALGLRAEAAIKAKVSNFRAVPGCGLEVKVSEVDEAAISASAELKSFEANIKNNPSAME